MAKKKSAKALNDGIDRTPKGLKAVKKVVKKAVKKKAAVMKYISKIPKVIPAGQILCHNHIKPAHPINTNGFRVWLTTPSDDYERCNCGWANGIEHYKGKVKK